ncbi:OsmC family protein [Arcticibacter sp.]|jgi:organic hydroperoxide reductase OsmC/OhrA|uniref:OsmC family protein n=1 Tax=Arcticibacter sp. TaxID=1872630 RepID=UPI00388E7529
MEHQHQYTVSVTWTGNSGKGTIDYKSYSREHVISIKNKNDISGSSDPTFRGDETKHNPEELLVSSLSSCHMLWYLHLCSQAGVVVMEYVDVAIGTMAEDATGGGRFVKVMLNPRVTVAEAEMVSKAHQLHKRANELCFIAKSVNFPVGHNPSEVVMGSPGV